MKGQAVSYVLNGKVVFSGVVEYQTADGWTGIRQETGRLDEAQTRYVRPSEFALTPVPNGRGQAWQARVSGSRLTGWGSRPDLAIADWRKQTRAAIKAKRAA